eukprot:6211717-Pleurochrysis_carterae.AAC.2
MHTPFREYPSESAKNRYKVPSRVTSISRVTCRVTRHDFLKCTELSSHDLQLLKQAQGVLEEIHAVSAISPSVALDKEAPFGGKGRGPVSRSYF